MLAVCGSLFLDAKLLREDPRAKEQQLVVGPSCLVLCALATGDNPSHPHPWFAFRH